MIAFEIFEIVNIRRACKVQKIRFSSEGSREWMTPITICVSSAIFAQNLALNLQLFGEERWIDIHFLGLHPSFMTFGLFGLPSWGGKLFRGFWTVPGFQKLGGNGGASFGGGDRGDTVQSPSHLNGFLTLQTRATESKHVIIPALNVNKNSFCGNDSVT